MSENKAGTAELTESIARAAKWVEDHHYKGYEPFDGLSSWARSLTFGNLLAERLLQQLIRQSPVNLRPILGVSVQDSTKGRGYMASGYLILHRLTGRQDYLDKAAACLDWLDKHKAPKFARHSWSNCFDFSSRGGKYTKDDPIIVWTSLIGQTCVEAYEWTGEKRWLNIADSACQWIAALPRERTEHGDCLSYLAFVQESIHNANMLGAALLARTAKHTANADYVKIARSAMQYSCTRQLPDGSWWYAEPAKYHWIDNFHTGYNLDSLKHYIDSTGDRTWAENLRRGLQFYKDHFFEPDGCPKYYHNRRYPVDSQCAGQSLDTLALFSDADPSCLALGLQVARWTIENMQDRDGHFYYRLYPLCKAKAPMLHWAQATIFKGMAHLLLKLSEPNPPLSAQSAAAGNSQHSPAPGVSQLRCVLVTPARNEEAFIEGTIGSVIRQTVRPIKWVIVSDGSTDRTDEIVRRYAAEQPWIELVRLPEHRDRQFAAKARAFNAGCERLASLDYDIIGNLDADITFEPEYLQFLLEKFAALPGLGVAGTPFSEDTEDPHDHTYAHQFASLAHVSGACQLFRKRCFDDVGGYVPVKAGAIDWIAVTTARMKGWQTRTFTEKVCFHHRKLGVGSGSPGKLRMRFHYGRKAYYVGGHPLWECLRGLFQMRQEPFILGGLWFIAGFFWAAMRRSERAVSHELMRFHRAEQMARLRRVFARSARATEV